MAQSVVASLGGWIYISIRAVGIAGFVGYMIFNPLVVPTTYDPTPSSTGASQPPGTTYVVLNTSTPIHSGTRLQGNATLPNYKVYQLTVPDCSQSQTNIYSVPVLFVLTSDQHSHWSASGNQGDPKEYVQVQHCWTYDTGSQTMWLKFDFTSQTDTYYWFVILVQNGYSSTPTPSYYNAYGYSAQLPKLNADIVNTGRINLSILPGWMMGIATVAGLGVDIYRRVARRKVES